MRAIHFFIGLVFDAIILVAAGGLVYAVFQPDLLAMGYGYLQDQAATRAGQFRLLGVGAVFFLLAFRSLFLVLFRGGAPTVVVADGPAGRVTLSHAALEAVLRRLVSMRHPGAALRRATAFLSHDGLDLHVRVDLDLVDTDLGEYTREIEAVVRDHFKQKLGIEVRQFNLQAGDRESPNPQAQGV
jgi:hypothetical protein